MAGHSVIVAGFGMRAETGVDSLRDALARAGGQADALATLKEKMEPLTALGREMGVRVVGVAVDAAQAQKVITQSAQSLSAHGTGSVAEACALAAAGPGARLLGARVASGDGRATCALAEAVLPGGPRSEKIAP